MGREQLDLGQIGEKARAVRHNIRGHRPIDDTIRDLADLIDQLARHTLLLADDVRGEEDRETGRPKG